MKKQSPQIESRISAIAKEVANGKERGELLVKFGKKWGISKTTFDRYLQKAKGNAKKLVEKAEKAASDVYVEERKEAVKSGVRTKTERLLFLQKQIDDSQADIDAGVKTDYVWVGGKAKKIIKQLTPLDKAYIRKTIRELQAEISKMEGDYSPTKVAQTNSDGKDVPVNVQVVLPKGMDFNLPSNTDPEADD